MCDGIYKVLPKSNIVCNQVNARNTSGPEGEKEPWSLNCFQRPLWKKNFGNVQNSGLRDSVNSYAGLPLWRVLSNNNANFPKIYVFCLKVGNVLSSPHFLLKQDPLHSPDWSPTGIVGVHHGDVPADLNFAFIILWISWFMWMHEFSSHLYGSGHWLSCMTNSVYLSRTLPCGYPLEAAPGSQSAVSWL